VNQQIRLVKIHAGNPKDPIKISLLVVDVADAPPYEALSYVWGSPLRRRNIWVDDCKTSVHENLFQAIQTLRNPESERLVWADAICIDQHSNVEKGHQVSFMSEIYERADSVIVYLGEATEETREAMRSLEYLINGTVETGQPPWSYSSLQDTEGVFRDILGRKWFERIWTVQEATLARHTILICGHHKVSWHCNLQTLRSIAFRIKSAAVSPYFSVASGYTSKLDWDPLLDIINNQLNQAARREGVLLHRNQLDLAFQFRGRESTDARDRYFALLRIVENENGGKLEFRPDCTLSLDEVHLQYMKEIQRISEIEDGAVPDV
jgi:hypothetical protein